MIKNILKPLTSLLILFSLLSVSLHASTLHRGNGAEPETLDIHKSSGVPEANIQRDLFEGLVSEAENGKLIPGVAERWEQDGSGKVWTFYLRKEARWSNSSPVVAQDFVFALRRAVNPTTASEYAFILWPLLNAKAINSGKIKEIEKLGAEAIDDYTLKIVLENPTSFLPGLLAHHMAYPLNQKALEKHGKKWTRANKLVSNGAYKLTEWVPQSHLILVKNEHFREANQVKIDTVIYYPTEDQSSAMKRFRAHELDITDDVPSSQIDWVKKNLPKAFRNSPYIGTYYLALNLEKEPFKDNKDLRRALSLAINRDILTKKVTKGEEIPAMGWVPPGMAGYTSQTMKESGSNQKERMKLAKALYEKAGFSKANPLEVELLYNTSENHKRIAIALAAMWKQVLGAKIKLRNEEWKVYLSSRSQRQFELIRAGWIGDYNDASNFLDLFRSDVGTMNPSSWKNTQYDELMSTAESEVDVQKRMELMQQAERILLEEMPLIPIYYYTTQHLINENIEGWEDNVMDIHPTRYLRKL
ncbi:MAG: peptide ABC transporter substrate-binding protein [Thiotrichaceae bacterium]